MKHMPTPCATCPFSRAVRPGALGGSPPETFIGQAFGPFVLPCHKACDFDDPDWKQKADATPQCAGAAIFRNHIGMTNLLPSTLHRLPANEEAVFSSSVEFIAHHKGVTQAEARYQLTVRSPFILLCEQLERPDNINLTKPESQPCL